MATSRRRPLNRVARLRRSLLIHTASAILILGIIGYPLGNYALSRYVDEWGVSPLFILLSSPKFLSVNEEEEIRVSVENQRNTDVQTKLRLDGRAIIGNETNAFFAEKIPRQEKIARRVSVTVPSDSGLIVSGEIEGQSAGLALSVSVNNQDFERRDLSIRIAPVASPRKLFTGVFTLFSAAIVGAAKQWWDISKQVAGKSK